MFEQFGSDSSKKNLDLNNLLPGANQSEVSHSFLSTLFQRWITKPEIEQVSGFIGNRTGDQTKRIAGETPDTHANQLAPALYWQVTDDQYQTMSFKELLSRAEFTGARLDRYSDWGTLTQAVWNPPVSFDKLINWNMYYWVDRVDVLGNPDYVTITRQAIDNDWSRSNKWFHVKDMKPEDYPYARQAVYPIIEFDNLKLSKWIKINRVWLKDGLETPDQPTLADVMSAGFTDTWMLVSETISPADDQDLIDTDPTTEFHTNTTELPRYVCGTNSVRVYYVTTNDDGSLSFTRTYSFAEIPDTSYQQLYNDTSVSTSIQLLSPPPTPINTELRVYVGASTPSDRLLDYVEVRRVDGTKAPTNLCSYYYIDQPKTANNTPIFNLYDTSGAFKTVGYIWRYQQDPAAEYNEVLKTRLKYFQNTEEFMFETDLVDSSNALRLYYNKTDNLTYSIWKGTSKYIPARVDRYGKITTNVDDDISSWEISPFISNNPRRETPSEYRLSELAQHLQAVVKGTTPNITVTNSGELAFVSSLVAPNLSATNLINFVIEQRQTNISIITDRIYESVAYVLSNQDQSQNIKVVDLPQRMFEVVKQQSLNNTDTNQPFVDSFSYNPDTGVGFPHILPSPAQLKWCEASVPQLSVVQTSNNSTRYRLTTHDSFITMVNVGTGQRQLAVDIVVPTKQIEQFVKSLGTSLTNSITAPFPKSNGAMWSKMQIRLLYRFEVTIFGGPRPTSNPSQSISWYDTETNQVFERDNNVWTVGNLVDYWVPINFEHMIAETLLLVETDMYNRAIEVTQPVNDYTTILKSQQRIADVTNCVLDEYNLVKYNIQPKNLGVDVITNIWNASYSQLKSELTGLYSVDPIGFWKLLTQNTTTPIRLSPRTNETLNVNSITGNLYDQSINEKIETYNANFSLINMFIRHNKLDSKKDSPLRIWSKWTTKLAYQTDTIIIPESLQVSHQCELIEDRRIILDKAERTNEIEFSNLIITLNTPGLDTDLPNGDGTGWLFNLSCSGPFRHNKKRFDVKKQLIQWNATIQTYETTNSEPLKWSTGEPVTFVNGGVISQTYYIRQLTDTKFELAETPEKAADSLGDSVKVDIGVKQVELQTIQRTFNTDTEFGTRSWIVPAADDSIITFNFPVVVQGVYGIVDFFTGYTKYMDAMGLRVNVGEVPYTDDDMGVVTSWEQQLIKGIQTLYSSRGMSDRSFPQLGQYTDRTQYNQKRIELNPFPRGVWFETPKGVLCDLYNTPYVDDLQSLPAIYDDRDNPIIVGLTPLRSDRVSSIFFTPSAHTLQTINRDSVLAKQHIAAGKVSVDSYQHVVVFEDRTQTDKMLFNRVANLKLGSLDVEFVRSKTHFYRPNCNGYIVTPTNVIPNFETVIDQQRNDCSMSAINEHVETTQQFRKSLGKYDLEAFKLIPTTNKTEYQFWQRLIRVKGTVEAIERFNKHELIGTADVDQHWAYKLGTFGAVESRKQYEFWLTDKDVSRETAAFVFKTVDTSKLTRFPVTYVGSDTESKWVDFFDTMDQKVGQAPIELTYSRSKAQPFFIQFANSSITTSSHQLGLGIFEHHLLCDTVDVNIEVYDLAQQYSITTKKATNTVFFQDFAYPGEVDSSGSRVFIVVDGAITQPRFIAGNSVTFIDKLPFGTTVKLIWVSNRQTYNRTITNSSSQDTLTNTVTLRNSTLNDSGYIRYVEHNNQTIEITDYKLPRSGQCCIVTIDGIKPDYDVISPVRVADSITSKIIKQLPAWDPRKDIHTNAYDQVDIKSAADPAAYTVDRTSSVRTSQFWSNPQVGQYWWNTQGLFYKPYDDPLRVNGDYQLDVSIETWGQLFDDQEIKVYEWVKSTEKPSSSISNGTAHSRLLTKTRQSNTIRAFITENKQTIFTSTTELLFDTGATVAIYASRTAKSAAIVGADFGEEYVLQKLSSTEFVLLNSITPLEVIELSDDCYIADTDWGNYLFTEVQPFIQRTQIARLRKQLQGQGVSSAIVPLNPIDPKFYEYLDANVKVWVNGVTSGVFVDPNFQYIRVLDDATGDDLVLTNKDEVTVIFTIDETNLITNASTKDPNLTIFVRDFPYTQQKQMYGAEVVDYYFYWVRGIFDTVPESKQQTTYATEYGLKYPADGNYITVNGVQGATQRSNNIEYQILNVRGLHDIRNPTLKTICIDIDKNLRTEFSTSKKVEHEKWVLFRERQRGLVPTPLLNAVKKTLLGVDYSVDPPLVVPTVARTLYDYFNNEVARFGTGREQVLCDKEDARVILQEVMTDAKDPNYSVDADSIVSSIDFANVTEAKANIDHLFASINPLLINKLVLRVVKFGLFKGYEYDDIFKTSYITVSAPQKLIGNTAA